MTTLAEHIKHFFDVVDSDNYIAEAAFDCSLSEIQRYFPIICNFFGNNRRHIEPYHNKVS